MQDIIVVALLIAAVVALGTQFTGNSAGSIGKGISDIITNASNQLGNA